MNRPPVLQRRGGATLVELLVCLALLGALCALAAALVHPFAVQYARIQAVSRAQMIADTIVEELRSDLLQARGTLRLADAAQTAGEAGQVFAPVADPEGRSGAALEFGIPGGYFLLLDAGAVPQTALPQGGSVPEQAAGTLHRRYYAAVSEPGQGDSYVYHGPGGYVADGYADAFAGGFYMGDAVALRFAVQSTAPGAAGETCVTALAVEVSVSRAGSEQPLYTRRTVLDTPNRPRLLTARDAAPGRDTAE